MSVPEIFHLRVENFRLEQENTQLRNDLASLERQKTEAISLLRKYDRLWAERDQARRELALLRSTLCPENSNESTPKT